MPKKPADPSSPGAKKHPKNPAQPSGSGASGQPGQPIFAQPKPSPDPTGFKDPVTDQQFQGIRTLEAVPQPRDGAVEPVLTLDEVYGSAGAAKIAAIREGGADCFSFGGRHGQRRWAGDTIAGCGQDGDGLQ
jgi:hypothetical protein